MDRKNYAKGWLCIDVVACIPLECILTAAAPRVNWCVALCHHTADILQLSSDTRHCDLMFYA